MSKRSKRRKHIPRRTCVACHATRPKRELVRVVRTPGGAVLVDETGKQNGRGAYICRQRTCWDRALERGLLDRALKITLSRETISELREYAGKLPQRLDEVDDQKAG